MNKNSVSYVRRALNDQRGQVLPWVAFGMVAFLGMAGLTTDVGHAYVVRAQLQNSTNAAALAAAGSVYFTGSTVTTEANLYAANSGDQNPNSYVTGTPTVTTMCLNVLLPGGTGCTTGSPSNAVKVTQTASVPTYFLRVLGITSIPVSATATASMGGLANSWNVAIIIDATSSVSTTDSNCGGLTEFQCELAGVQTFLAATNPCPAGGCASGSNVRVSLFSFPNLSTTGYSDTSTCGSTFTNKPYTLPTTTATSYAPIQYTGTTAYTATYQLAGWDTGYYLPSSTSTGGLNSSDNLVKVIGYGANSKTGALGQAGCLPNKGGEETYYGGVLYAAQAALLAEQAANPLSQNALILLSDGQANAPYAKFPQKTSTPSPAASGIAVTSSGSSSVNLTGAANTFGKYPDFNDECQQAIVAAQAATTAGTRVYAVAYGSEQTGCGSGGTDSTLVATGHNAAFGSVSALTPCVTMENIASSMSYFYSDYNESGSGSTCQDASHPVTSLQDIFLAISSTLTTPKLLPNNAT